MEITNKEPQISLGKDFDAEDKMLEKEAKNISIAKRGKTLDEIWGIKKNSQFPAKTEEEYKNHLKNYNKCDLHAECIKQAVPPRDNRDMMIKDLMKEFRKFAARSIPCNIHPRQIKLTPEVSKLINRD